MIPWRRDRFFSSPGWRQMRSIGRRLTRSRIGLRPVPGISVKPASANRLSCMFSRSASPSEACATIAVPSGETLTPVPAFVLLNGSSSVKRAGVGSGGASGPGRIARKAATAARPAASSHAARSRHAVVAGAGTASVCRLAAARPVPSVIASRANARSRADWNRCSGAFSRQRRIRRSRAGGVVPSGVTSSAGSRDSTALMASALVAAANGRVPLSISNSIAPSAKMSAR